MTALLVQVAGETVPLTDCTWVFRAPCGCAHSIMSAATDHRVCAAADQAWEHLEPNDRVRAARLVARTSPDAGRVGLGEPAEPGAGKGTLAAVRVGRAWRIPWRGFWAWATTDTPATVTRRLLDVATDTGHSCRVGTEAGP